MEFFLLCFACLLAWSNGAKLNRLLKASAAMLLLCGSTFAQAIPSVNSMALEVPTRVWYHNGPDGCCVQMSIGMAGVHCNDLNAASLPFDSDFGPAERGGSIPSRVEAYCDKRGIRAWSVTGNSVEDTLPWVEWAAKTGRFAAIGAGAAHFQTLYGYDPVRKRWFVCNNNSPDRVDEYTDAQFRLLHSNVKWVVILEKPSSMPPEFSPWWK